MPTQKSVPRLYLNIDGSKVSPDVSDSIISIEVDDSIDLPDIFAVHLRDKNAKWVDSDAFSLGKPVEIKATNSGQEVTMIFGEITSIDPRFNPSSGPTLILRGYDLSHRLNRDRKTRSFLQMKDSDIALKIAKEAKLKTKIDATRQVHVYVLQDNKTDWEFLMSRARRIGYRLLVKEDTLHFEKAPKESQQPPVIEWRENLIMFNARMSTALQVSEVVVHGWDPGTQKQIVGRATTVQDVPQIGEKRKGGQAADQAFGIAAKRIVVDYPVADQAEADELAQSICDEIGQGFIEAECVCSGNPEIHAGAIVELKGVGTRFSGTYRITHALHRYNASGYTTEFTIGGRHTSTLSELVLPKRLERSRIGSPVLGVVTNNDDPDKLGRVKVKLPSLADTHESYWARLVSPGAGKDKGFLWIPDVGDEVLVLFEYGDIHYPLVIGGLWSQKAPIVDSSNLVDSGKGVAVHIDTHEKMGMTIMDKPNDTWLQLGDQDNHLSLDKTNREAVLKSADKINMQGLNISIDADNNIEIKSKGNIKIEGSGLVEIKGSTIKLN